MTTTTARPRQATLRTRISERHQENTSLMPGATLNLAALGRNSKRYEQRIETLLGYASEEDIVASNASIRDFNLFVDAIIPTDKAMLAIMDNGHLRATWRKHRTRLSLEFIGDRKVHYVALIGVDSSGKPREDSGECSFDEIRVRTKAWELWGMVTS